MENLFDEALSVRNVSAEHRVFKIQYRKQTFYLSLAELMRVWELSEVIISPSVYNEQVIDLLRQTLVYEFKTAREVLTVVNIFQKTKMCVPVLQTVLYEYLRNTDLERLSMAEVCTDDVLLLIGAGKHRFSADCRQLILNTRYKPNIVWEGENFSDEVLLNYIKEESPLAGKLLKM